MLLRNSRFTERWATTAMSPVLLPRAVSRAALNLSKAAPASSAPGMGSSMFSPRARYSSGQRRRMSSKLSPSQSPAYCSMSPGRTRTRGGRARAVSRARDRGLEKTAETRPPSSRPKRQAWSRPRVLRGSSELPRQMCSPPGSSGCPWRIR